MSRIQYPLTQSRATSKDFHKTTGHITVTTAKVTTTWAKPAATAAFQVVLKNSIEVRPEAGIDVYDIDLDSSPATFRALQDAKKYIVCYFSAGTSEVYRKDVGCFNHKMGSQDYGKGYSSLLIHYVVRICHEGCNFGGEFPDEFWLNTTSPKVRRIMQSRIQYAKDQGCNAIDPDNMDGYNNLNGIGATPEDAINFFKFLSAEARSRGMGIGLKNSLDIIANVTAHMDFAVNEECLDWLNDGPSECTRYAPLFALPTPLPVFNIEYPVMKTTWNQTYAEAKCNASIALNLPYLHTNLKNYPTVDCGVIRCGASSPNPSLDLQGKLPIPAGCINHMTGEIDGQSQIAA